MKTLSFAILLTLLTSACRSEVKSPTSNVQSPKADVRDQVSDVRQSALQKQIEEIAAEAKGKVGVAAVILDGTKQEAAGGNQAADSRQQEAVASINAQERFPMQSVYKLPISMAVMSQVDAGKLRLDQKVRVTKDDMVGANLHSPIRDRFPSGAELSIDDLIRYAIAESDGTASDVLMRIAGGPAPVQKYLTDLPVPDMIVLNTEKELGQDSQLQYSNYSTPDAAVALLRALHERRGLSESSQALLLKYLIESKPGAQRLKGLLPAGTTVAHKTGTSGTLKGVTAATNDIGIITLPTGRHLAIAVFVSDSPGDLATREGVIARIARAAFEAANR